MQIRERERERERESKRGPRIGIPIGNLTSQIFANIYLNELDQFAKHTLRVKHYVRYTDDFIVVADSPAYLKTLLPSMGAFLSQRLALELHPEKVYIRPFHQGVDFLGYVIFPHYRLLRSRTRKRMVKKLRERAEQRRLEVITEYSFRQTLQSYLGVLSHANTHKLGRDLKNRFWL